MDVVVDLWWEGAKEVAVKLWLRPAVWIVRLVALPILVWGPRRLRWEVRRGCVVADRHGSPVKDVELQAAASPGLAALSFDWIRGALIRRVELLRLVFGVVWAIDAYLKGQPSFVNGYAKNVAAGAQGRPGWLRPWFHFWRHVTNQDPHLRTRRRWSRH